MKADKMPTVVCNDDPILPDRSRQHRLIRRSLTRDSTFSGCPNIMAQFAQDLHDAQGEIFVCVEQGHGSRRLVVDDLLLDLLAVLPCVGPGIGQVFRAQGRVIAQQFRFAHSQSLQLDEEPNGNPGTNDTRFAAANRRVAFDPGSQDSQVAHDPLEHQRLFTDRHLVQQPLDFLKICHFAPCKAKGRILFTTSPAPTVRTADQHLFPRPSLIIADPKERSQRQWEERKMGKDK